MQIYLRRVSHRRAVESLTVFKGTRNGRVELRADQILIFISGSGALLRASEKKLMNNRRVRTTGVESPCKKVKGLALKHF